MQPGKISSTWIEAGFEDEMLAIRKAIAAAEEDRIPSLMSDRWLSEVTLYGSGAEQRWSPTKYQR